MDGKAGGTFAAIAKDLDLNQNPYNSPAATAVVTSPKQSLRAYWYASGFVVLFIAICVGVILWATNAEIEAGEIWFNVPNETTFSSGYDDSIAVYDSMISTSLVGAIMLVAIFTGLALAIVNGLVLIWRVVRRRKTA